MAGGKQTLKRIGELCTVKRKFKEVCGRGLGQQLAVSIFFKKQRLMLQPTINFLLRFSEFLFLSRSLIEAES